VDLTAEVAATIGSLALVAGAAGLMRLMRGRRVTLGQLGAALLAVGLIGQTGSLAFNIFDIAMADFDDRKTMAAFRHELVHDAAYSAYSLTFVLGGIVIGSIVLAIALVRRRIVPIWSPILLAVGTSVWFVSSEERLVNAVSNVLVLAALLPLALLIWSLSDDEWEQWVLPLAGSADGSVAEASHANKTGPSPTWPSVDATGEASFTDASPSQTPARECS
jgi:hypothetical protein